jgi:hypothetical protein
VESPPFQQQRPVAPAGEQPAADQQAAHDGSLPR